MIAFKLLTADGSLTGGSCCPGVITAARVLAAPPAPRRLLRRPRSSTTLRPLYGRLRARPRPARLALPRRASSRCFAAEINVVRARRLWPRELLLAPLLDADKRALTSSAEAEERVEERERRGQLRRARLTLLGSHQPAVRPATPAGLRAARAVASRRMPAIRLCAAVFRHHPGVLAPATIARYTNYTFVSSYGADTYAHLAEHPSSRAAPPSPSRRPAADPARRHRRVPQHGDHADGRRGRGRARRARAPSRERVPRGRHDRRGLRADPPARRRPRGRPLRRAPRADRRRPDRPRGRAARRGRRAPRRDRPSTARRASSSASTARPSRRSSSCAATTGGSPRSCARSPSRARWPTRPATPRTSPTSRRSSCCARSTSPSASSWPSGCSARAWPSCRCASASARTSRRAPRSSSASTSCASRWSRSARSSARTRRSVAEEYRTKIEEAEMPEDVKEQALEGARPPGAHGRADRRVEHDPHLPGLADRRALGQALGGAPRPGRGARGARRRPRRAGGRQGPRSPSTWPCASCARTAASRPTRSRARS